MRSCYETFFVYRKICITYIALEKELISTRQTTFDMCELNKIHRELRFFVNENKRGEDF